MSPYIKSLTMALTAITGNSILNTKQKHLGCKKRRGQ